MNARNKNKKDKREREKKLVSVCLEPLTGLFLEVAERNAHQHSP